MNSKKYLFQFIFWIIYMVKPAELKVYTRETIPHSKFLLNSYLPNINYLISIIIIRVYYLKGMGMI